MKLCNISAYILESKKSPKTKPKMLGLKKLWDCMVSILSDIGVSKKSCALNIYFRWCWLYFSIFTTYTDCAQYWH